MSVFNEYGNIQDEQTKNARELIDDICKKELTRLAKEGASVTELKAVVRDFLVAVDLAGSDVIIEEQQRWKRMANSKAWYFEHKDSEILPSTTPTE